MTTEVLSVTSRLGYVRLDTASTVSASSSAPAFTLPHHAVTSADTTSAAFAITIPVTVDIIHLMANVIAATSSTMHRLCA